MSKYILHIKISCYFPENKSKPRDIEKFWKFDIDTSAAIYKYTHGNFPEAFDILQNRDSWKFFQTKINLGTAILYVYNYIYFRISIIWKINPQLTSWRWPTHQNKVSMKLASKYAINILFSFMKKSKQSTKFVTSRAMDESLSSILGRF